MPNISDEHGNFIPDNGQKPSDGHPAPAAGISDGSSFAPINERRTASIPPPEQRGASAPPLPQAQSIRPQPPGAPSRRQEPIPAPPQAQSSPGVRPAEQTPSRRIGIPAPQPQALPSPGQPVNVIQPAARSAPPAPLPERPKNTPVPHDDKTDDEDAGSFRRRKRANVGCLRGLLYFLIVIGVSCFLAVFGWGCVNDVLALMKPSGEVTVTVPEGYTIPELSRILKDAGVIEHGWLFTLYCNFSKADQVVDPGEYTLSTSRDYRALVHDMTEKPPERTTVRVKIVEGRTLRQTLRQLADAGVAPMEDLLAAVETGEFGYAYLDDLPEGDNRLEGFLYPDTYDFYVGGNPSTALRKLVSNFDMKYTASMRKRVSEMAYSLHEILTVASLVQMEAAGVSDMKDIASVIYNRLEKWEVPRLDIDATVQYLLPEHKEVLTAEDLAIDSPYNTRKYPGLPPGPICSPSIEAIRAALYPSNTKYYFYCMTDAGVHAFCQTEAELNNIKKSNPKTYPNYGK